MNSLSLEQADADSSRYQSRKKQRQAQSPRDERKEFPSRFFAYWFHLLASVRHTKRGDYRCNEKSNGEKQKGNRAEGLEYGERWNFQYKRLDKAKHCHSATAIDCKEGLDTLGYMGVLLHAQPSHSCFSRFAMTFDNAWKAAGTVFLSHPYLLFVGGIIT
ncbi:hypothetical protein [Janthinobacterium sp.]|uniref:hypothetical protein n=1 Tax=Janthinobacterium sp. TaxID=1871054 RepID=UPI0026110806|nr:hypothetical protein [Janthinobacterium sp.]